ncbi:MAG: hypothetical protein OEY58_19400 [Gammaproteobacteria bacterium]|nr:hypothetical protein [Gammaproteobacteria bacterium]
MMHVSDYFSETGGCVTIKTPNPRGFAHDSETMSVAFAKNPDRFKRHREGTYTLPPMKTHPFYIQEAEKRLGQLFNTGIRWHVKDYSRRLWQRFKYHNDKLNKDGRKRKVRDQFLLSLDRVLRCLVLKCNIQPNNRLNNLEVNDLALVDIAHWTGLSLSTANDCIVKLKLLGLYRSKPMKIKKRDESGAIYYREGKSKKWLTWKLFDLLGMKKKIKKNLGDRIKPTQPPSVQPAFSAKACATNNPNKTAAKTYMDEIRGMLSSADPP